MGSVLLFVLVYIVGGLTFIPVVIILVLTHAYFTFPIVEPASNVEHRGNTQPDLLHQSGEIRPDLSSLPPELQKVDRERDAAAGYFAICREYVPGGVNGKPPERLTPAGEVISVESPSVYQSMYRSIFDRGKAQAPSLDNSGGSVKATKKARNVFYVVLRLGHLMLYDNAEQLEVRHVISLGLYKVDVHGGGEDIPEGELWVKRNCIRLVRKDLATNTQDSKPYFLFGDNCSEKEDFFHALIRNQHRSSAKTQRPTTPLQFAPEHMVKLIQQLHASEEFLQTRWFNALLGRLFLSMYKTSEVQSFILAKITKKLTRIQKPTFIEDIKVGRIDLGQAAPLFTNPKLRELTLDGELVLETDVKYSGNFKLEIAATALIDLGQRFKVRRIDILLAVLCKSLDGHLLVKVKPPPSNRLWISFETMPKMDLSIDPIVSSRQITYGIILRTIESKIREVMGETLVFPNWDDVPFHDTKAQKVRGGIWETEAVSDDITASMLSQSQTDEQAVRVEPAIIPKSQSTPTLVRRRPVGSGNSSKANTINGDLDNGTSTSRESIDIRKKTKSSRSTSFATSSPPIVSMSPTHASAIREDGQYALQDAASSMKGLSGRSSSNSSVKSELPFDLTDTNLDAATATEDSSEESRAPEEHDIFALEMPDDHKLHTRSGTLRSSIESLKRPNTEDFEKKRKSIAANAQVAAAAAKKWGFDLVAKRTAQADSTYPHELNQDLPTNGSTGNMPIGRGQPLPPPGTPLPGPPTARKNWGMAFGSLNKKKADSSPSIGGYTNEGHRHDPPPLPPRPDVEGAVVSKNPASSDPRTRTRKSSAQSRRGTSIDNTPQNPASDDILVIRAPVSDGEGDDSIDQEHKQPSESLERFGLGIGSKPVIAKKPLQVDVAADDVAEEQLHMESKPRERTHAGSAEDGPGDAAKRKENLDVLAAEAAAGDAQSLEALQKLVP